MVIIKDILYLSFNDLKSFGFTDSYLYKVSSEARSGDSNNYLNIPDPDDNRRVLIQYSSIPARAIKERGIPSESQLREQYRIQQLEASVKSHCGLYLDKARNHYSANPNSYQYSIALADQSSWLLWLASLRNKDAKAHHFASLEELYEKSIDLLAKKNWERWKCNSVQVLRRKLKPFLKLYKKPLNGDFSDEHFYEALDSLIHKGFGNSNREKLSDSQRAVIFQRYADGDSKPNIEQVYMSYLETARQKIQAGEWTTDALVSLSTVKNFLYQEDIQQAYWSLRHGKQQYRAKYEIITKRKKASFANALWIIDGTPCHLYYRDGDNAYARLNVFVVLDAFSWCVVGFYVSDSENHDQVIGALRAACTLSGTLPYQIQSDNGSAVSGYFGRTCIQTLANYFTPATPGNARSKPIESFFKHFNNRVARFYPGFTHSPVMGKNINSIPNPEALQRQLREDQIVGKRQAIEKLHEMFAVWNRLDMADGVSPLSKYQTSIEGTKELQRPLTEQVFVEAFYTMPGALKKVRGTDASGNVKSVQSFIPELYEYTNEGIEIVIDKSKHSFITDDPGFNKKFIGKRFAVKLDRQNPDKLYLYQPTQDGIKPLQFNSVHMALKAPHLFSQALVDRTEGEGKQLHEHLSRKKQQTQGAIESAQRFIEITQSEGTYLKLTPGNAFPKHVLTAAKQAITEGIINGESHRITKEKLTAKGIPTRTSDRWDNLSDQDTTPVSTPVIKSHSDDEYDNWR